MSSSPSSHTSSVEFRQPKPLRLVLSELSDSTSPAIYAFPPNRETLGGTAYLILENSNILIDCPLWDENTQAQLEAKGGIQWLFVTHRDSIGQAKAVQKAFNCPIVIQEQEAYLLPGLNLITFHHSCTLTPQTRALWTPGYSPGSACLYHSGFGGVLFTGRHLLPTPQGSLAAIKTAKTFHSRRQHQSIQNLLDEFTPDTLQYICPGANSGFLRGKFAIANAYEQLKHNLGEK
ncbi:MAG: MBL fold metallo-hydrolase [Leptolyngbyaceae cyanobacterium bins.302]|nr:MBL fold metallo-hydrolase [Leptolyngbyaceae cyanobacterium bins.302]